MTDINTKQVAQDVPIWDLFYDGEYVGLLTDFPGEGPAYTVRWGSWKATGYGSKTLHEAYDRARSTFAAYLDGLVEEDEHIEDEDGSIAFVLWLERRAEAQGRDDEIPF